MILPENSRLTGGGSLDLLQVFLILGTNSWVVWGGQHWGSGHKAEQESVHHDVCCPGVARNNDGNNVGVGGDDDNEPGAGNDVVGQ